MFCIKTRVSGFQFANCWKRQESTRKITYNSLFPIPKWLKWNAHTIHIRFITKKSLTPNKNGKGIYDRTKIQNPTTNRKKIKIAWTFTGDSLRKRNIFSPFFYCFSFFFLFSSLFFCVSVISFSYRHKRLAITKFSNLVHVGARSYSPRFFVYLR